MGVGQAAPKLIALGVVAKAVLMTAVVTILGATTFLESLALILTSATATGIFGLLIVIVQVRGERALHQRMDTIEKKADNVQVTADNIAHEVVPELRHTEEGA